MPSWLLTKDQMRERIRQEDRREEEKIYIYGYWQWYRDFIDKNLDEIQFRKDWIKCMRLAYSLTMEGMAKRLNLSLSTYVSLEKSEQTQAISLRKLQQVAEKFNCELVYSFKPKNDVRLSEYVWKEIYQEFIQKVRNYRDSPLRKAKTLVGEFMRQMSKLSERKKRGWALPSTRLARNDLREILE